MIAALWHAGVWCWVRSPDRTYANSYDLCSKLIEIWPQLISLGRRQFARVWELSTEDWRLISPNGLLPATPALLILQSYLPVNALPAQYIRGHHETYTLVSFRQILTLCDCTGCGGWFECVCDYVYMGRWWWRFYLDQWKKLGFARHWQRASEHRWHGQYPHRRADPRCEPYDCYS